MSDAMKINQGAVTSLSDSDMVMASDSGGSFRSISMSNFLASILSSIKIGGRNLLKGTASPFVMSTYPSQSARYNLATLLSKEDPGSQITVSFSYEYSDIVIGSGTSSHRLGVQIPVKQMSGYQFYVECNYTLDDAKSGKGRYKKTVTLPEGMDLDYTYASVYAQGVDRGNVRIFDIKIERGNVATDWSPAPEDLVGGVKRYITTICNLLQKGGQHD